MSVQGMNHFTVLSDDLEVTKKFYCDLLGFEVGPRPNFQFPGWWLYVGDQPILHVIHRDKLHDHRAGVLDHMAFTATDLPGTVAKLDKAKVKWELRRLPLESTRGGPSRLPSGLSLISTSTTNSCGSLAPAGGFQN